MRHLFQAGNGSSPRSAEFGDCPKQQGRQGGGGQSQAAHNPCPGWARHGDDGKVVKFSRAGSPRFINIGGDDYVRRGRFVGRDKVGDGDGFVLGHARVRTIGAEIGHILAQKIRVFIIKPKEDLEAVARIYLVQQLVGKGEGDGLAAAGGGAEKEYFAAQIGVIGLASQIVGDADYKTVQAGGRIGRVWRRASQRDNWCG